MFLSCKTLNKSAPTTISLKTSAEKGLFPIGFPSPYNSIRSFPNSRNSSTCITLNPFECPVWFIFVTPLSGHREIFFNILPANKCFSLYKIRSFYLCLWYLWVTCLHLPPHQSVTPLPISNMTTSGAKHGTFAMSNCLILLTVFPPTLNKWTFTSLSLKLLLNSVF